MFEGASFFTLSPSGQAGLLGLSILLAVCTLWLTRRVARNRPWAIRLLIALVAVFAFEWLSPQLYYLYYIQLFELPLQLVIGMPPTPTDLLRILTFTAQPDLSHLSRGVLAWALILASLFQRSRAT